jgi:nicotinate-nucleotide adenylyltransferase
MRIGILGGTFDPIHQGHLLLARAAQKQYQLDKVIFIPALIPPHKTGRRDMTPAPYRYRMVELALKDQPGFEISNIEFDRPEISYTVDTLRALRKRGPHDEFFLIIGADAAADISSWKEAEEIPKLATLLAAGRPGYECAKDQAVCPVAMPEMPLSSSAIREKLAGGHGLGSDFLPHEVEMYIRKMNLYSKKS